MTVLLHEDWGARLRKNGWVFAGYAAVALLTIAQLKGSVIGHAYESSSIALLEGKVVLPGNPYFNSVLTQSWLFFKYGLLWLLPNPAWVSVDMREPFAQGLFSVYGAALVAYLLYGWLAIRLLLKRSYAGLIGFALLFPWLMFATELSTVRFQEIFVLYRSYLWALGGVMLLPLLLIKLNARLTVIVSILCTATLFMISMERLSTFSHPITLWDDAEKLVKDRQSLPGAGRIYYNRGTEWLKIEKYDKALPDLQTATRLSPSFSSAFGNLGFVFYKTGQNEQAIQAFSRAIELDQEQKAPPSYKYYYSRATSYEANGQQLKASLDYKASCLINSRMGCDKAGLH
jgi:tetratricopeptide (TPR) repeat protein